MFTATVAQSKLAYNCYRSTRKLKALGSCLQRTYLVNPVVDDAFAVEVLPNVAGYSYFKLSLKK